MSLAIVRVPTGLAWRMLGVDALLDLLGGSLALNARHTPHGDALVVLATCLADDVPDRRAWLAARLAPDGGPEVAPPGATDALVETLGWLARGRDWTPLAADEPPRRFTPPREPDLPPVVLAPRADDVLVSRAVPLLPAPGASGAVRLATVHAVLRLNAWLRAARVVVTDPHALMVAVEAAVPADRPCAHEAGWLLDGVRYGVRPVLEVLACLRHPAVAAEYAIAHSLPVDAGRERRTEV